MDEQNILGKFRHTDRWLSKNELNVDEENIQRNPPEFILENRVWTGE